MKENVDLTENRDFRKSSFSRLSLNKLSKYIKRIHNLDFPWSDVTQITSTIDKEEELFFVGNNETRRYKRMSNVIGYEMCERCGAKLRKIPWRYEYGLCKECDDYMINEVGNSSRCPWNKI